MSWSLTLASWGAQRVGVQSQLPQPRLVCEDVRAALTFICAFTVTSAATTIDAAAAAAAAATIGATSVVATATAAAAAAPAAAAAAATTATIDVAAAAATTAAAIAVIAVIGVATITVFIVGIIHEYASNIVQRHLHDRIIHSTCLFGVFGVSNHGAES